MSLSPGTRVGPYEITAKLGAGGMGEVYRALDSNLKRSVAIKVLPASVGADVDRLARFQREAEVLAALNHPNIAQVYGLERQVGHSSPADTIALVMELVEGEGLDEMIGRRPNGLPLEDALNIARQIADALEGAHEQGIIHRDLKPANIKVRADGTVKVLDFGLAKALEQSRVSSLQTPAPSVSMSPTLTSPALVTGVGMILGTAAYMAPEQARGKPVDRRADIWAFGCVLFEMLTGERAFAAGDITDTIVALVSKTPRWDALPATSPPGVLRLLRSCLEKDPRRRLQAIGDARVQIEDVIDGRESGVTGTLSPGAASPPRPRPRWMYVAIALLLVASAALLVPAVRHLREPALAPARINRFVLQVPPNMGLYMQGTTFSVSPDGQQIAMMLNSANGVSYWVQRFDSYDAAPIRGAEAALGAAVWCDDNRSIVFPTAADKFERLDVRTSTVLGSFPLEREAVTGVACRGDGTVLAGSVGGVRIYAPNGESQLVKAQPGELGRIFPTLLPDGAGYAYIVPGNGNEAGVYVVPAGTSSPRLLVRNVGNAAFAPGVVAYARGQSLYAQRVDMSRWATVGDPVMLAPDVRVVGNPGRALFSMSADGHVLVYQAGGSDSRLRVLDRAGHAAPDELPTGVFESPALSRDGQRLAIVKTDPVTSAANVAILDVGRKAMTRLTNGATRDTDPVWSPSGDQLAYTSLQSDGRKHFYIMPSAGGAAREFKPPELSRGGLDDWSRDGRWILYHDTGNRLMALDITRASEPVVVAVSSGARQPDQGAFSPTGEAVAFDSFESTSAGSEVYVVPFPATGARWQVSTAGGVQPQWREDGKEMFFLAPDGTMMAVDILGFGPNFKAGVPHALFKTQVVPVFQQSQYVVSADGSRFILVEPNGRDGNQALRVITDWPAALNGAGNN